MKLFILYMLVMNTVTFCMMGYDKKRAKRHERRVPEKRLFGYSAIGGALGAWIGMWTWRHKTKHGSFVFGIPALLVMNIAVIYLLYRAWNLVA
ncbi:DUF1294 domain-containing protein [Paenibacillus sp. P26]|nr:DUF1294 domain-containing protein [Paenibacillus sp. P26]UUZ92096.1 DUF1294 domain-containing protein [Paenibacillus sp. P25]